MTTNANKRAFQVPKIIPILLRVVASLVIVAAGGLTLYVFGQKPEIPKDEGTKGTEGVLVDTIQIEEYTKPIVVEVDGEATTYRVVTVGTEVSGRIQYKSDNARSGNFVQTGDELFRVDSSEYDIELQRQQSVLTQTDEEVRALNVDLDNLSTLISLAEEDRGLQQSHLQRTLKLFERRAASETDLDNARQQELSARNNLQKLKNDLSSKERERATTQARRKVEESALKRAKLDVERCVIRAPISGRVVDDQIEEGNFVSIGQTLVKISDASQMEVRCQFQPREIAWIWKQQVEDYLSSANKVKRLDPIELHPVTCDVVYEFSGIETTWKGQLSRFDGTGLSRETRTFPARIIVEAPEKTTTRQIGAGPISVTPPTLLSGMFVSVRIPVELDESLLSVPVEAVRPGGKLWVNQNGILKIHDVTIAKVIDEIALLRSHSDLSPGQEVIISPLPAVTDGMQVRSSSDVADAQVNATVEQGTAVLATENDEL